MRNLCLMVAVIAILMVSGSRADAVKPGWIIHAPTGKVVADAKFASDGTNSPVVPNVQSPKHVMVGAKAVTMDTTSTIQSCVTTYLPKENSVRIAELARGLHYNWEKCFDFVRNNVRFTPYPGFVRGPERTLIDMEGNDADQAWLLLSLLRESGYTNSKLVYVPIRADSNGHVVSGFQIETAAYKNYGANGWLRITDQTFESEPYSAAYTLANAGHTVYTSGIGVLTTDHYWVQLSEGDRTYALDPSVKPDIKQASSDVKTLMGYNRSALLETAKGVVDAYSVRNLSYDMLGDVLNQYVEKVSQVVSTNGVSTSNLLGDSRIVRRAQDDACFHGTVIGNESLSVLDQSSTYINGMRTLVSIKLNNSLLCRFYLDEIGARNLWLSYVENGSSACTAQLMLDNQLIATQENVTKGKATLNINVAHSEVPCAHDYTLEVASANVHSIVVGFDGDVSSGMRKIAVQKMADARNHKLLAGSPDMLAVSSFNAGQQWLAQTHLIKKIRSRLLNKEEHDYFTVGISGQAGGPYVDVANAVSYGVENHKHFTGIGMFVSALEHSVIEQLNGVGCQSVSTVKILSLANAAGIPIYFLTKNNVSSAIGGLSNYSSSQLSDIRNTAAADYYVLAPQNADITLNEWKGAGYATFGPVSSDITTAVSVGMYISGGYNGGYSSEKGTPNADNYFDNASQNYYDNGAVSPSTQSDPIAMPAGAFLDRVADLELNRHVPLRWVRSYDSRGRLDDGGLGRGWSHGFDASIVETTDVDAFFGRGSVEAVLPTVVALTVVDDLLADQETVSAGENARRWTLAALVIQWWSECLCRNALSVKLGAQMLGYTKRMDGTYAPAPGVTATLTASGSGYELSERSGNTYSFNSDKRLSKVTDKSGNETTLVYDGGVLKRVANGFEASLDLTWSNGRIATVADNAGRTVSYAYDANGCLTGVTDVRGKVWSMAYDPSSYALTRNTDPDGQVILQNVYNDAVQVTNQTSAVGGETVLGYAASRGGWDRNPAGYVLEQEYDENGRSVVRTERDGGTTLRTYDGHGHATNEINAIGTRQAVVYDGRDNVISVTTGAGEDRRSTVMAYDSADLLTRLTDGIGRQTTFDYDSSDRIVKLTRPDGTYRENSWNAKGQLLESRECTQAGAVVSRTTFTYGSYGLPTTTTRYGMGLPSGGVVETCAYNGYGLPSQVTDANGHTVAFAYDAAGHEVSRTDALGRVERRGYSAAGYLTSRTDALNRQTRYAVTSSGKIASIEFPDGAMSSLSYNSSDELSLSVSTRGTETTYLYDEMGRVAKVSSPALSAEVVYDFLGNPVEESNGAHEVTTTTYDSLSRPDTVKNGLGNVWRMHYDAADQLVQSVTPLAKATGYAYDNRGNRTATTKPSGAKDTFTYDALGNMVSYANASGNAYRMAYDAEGRMIGATNALGKCVLRAEYDGVGNLIRRTDGEGETLTFAYDAANRLVSRSGAGIEDAYVYDAADNVIGASSAEVDEEFAYDARDRLTSASVSVDGYDFDLAWTRDAGGLVTSTTYDTGKTVSREYDADGRLTKVSDWLGHRWLFSYDGAGRLLGVTSPDAADAAFSYDGAGRLASWSVDGIAGRALTRDAAGRRIKDTITVGNVPSPTVTRADDYTFNAADQLVSAKCADGASVTYTYNGNGALLRARSNAKQVAGATYAADGLFDSFAISRTVTTCTRDAFGNQIAYGASYWIPDFTDDLKRPLMEVDDYGEVVRYYIWGNGRLLGYVDEDDELTVAHTDDYGSVIALTTTDGAKIHTANYGPNGEDYGSTGKNPTPFGWMGGYGVRTLGKVDTLGTVYATRYRLYSSAHRRFLASDPMGLAGGLNLYAYGNGNPVAYIDPLGLCAGESGYSMTDRLASGTTNGRTIPYDANPYDYSKDGKYHKGDKIRFSDGFEYEVKNDSMSYGQVKRDLNASGNSEYASEIEHTEGYANAVKNFGKAAEIAADGTGHLSSLSNGGIDMIGTEIINLITGAMTKKE